MAGEGSHTQADLVAFQPRHETFVGIDSDGCVFDSMGPKQRDHFHPLIVKFWRLEPIEREVRAVAEFVNLYSVWRGQNRFPALLKVFELLPTWPGIESRGVALPPTASLRAYVESGLPLGNPSLVEFAAGRRADAAIQRILEWNQAVNASIAGAEAPIPPIDGVRASLQRVREHSDAIVVSQTPAEALEAEWRRHDLVAYVSIIAGQELGTKAEHLRLATGGRYRAERVLLIGDALGDLRAARENGACFYPIVPGDEAAAWHRFCDEAYDRFLNGSYAGDYEAGLVADFEACLPETPPWLA
jgi:phosphoglycolate phosphatase-like HAD superfamily hydrolase